MLCSLALFHHSTISLLAALLELGKRRGKSPGDYYFVTVANTQGANGDDWMLQREMGPVCDDLVPTGDVLKQAQEMGNAQTGHGLLLAMNNWMGSILV